MLAALQALIPDLVLDALHLLIIYIIGQAIIRGIILAVLASMSAGKKSPDFRDRERTVKKVIRITGNTILYSILVFLVLDVLGIDIRPLLAGAGALGLIAGLGAQTVLKDFVSGILIAAEDQYRVGERVKINSVTEGVVTRIQMRLTTLRGDNDEVEHILNSSITTVTNLSRKAGAKKEKPEKSDKPIA